MYSSLPLETWRDVLVCVPLPPCWYGLQRDCTNEKASANLSNCRSISNSSSIKRYVEKKYRDKTFPLIEPLHNRGIQPRFFKKNKQTVSTKPSVGWEMIRRKLSFLETHHFSVLLETIQCIAVEHLRIFEREASVNNAFRDGFQFLYVWSS